MKALGAYLPWVVALVIVLWPTARPTRPQAWDYRVLSSTDPAQTSHILDSLGAEGWELTAASGPVLYLKRVVP